MAVKFESIAQDEIAKRTFTRPGLNTRLERAVEGMVPIVDHIFGTTIAAPQGAKAIRDLTALGASYHTQHGEFSTTGQHLGGTGPTMINGEPQTYTPVFTAENHVFTADGVRLQNTLSGGSFNTYLRGQVISGSTAGTGLIVNSPGYSFPTAIADIGITSSDIDKITVGDVVTVTNSGWAFVSAKDKAAGTVTFETLTGANNSTGAGIKSNWHISFMSSFAGCPIAEDVADGALEIKLVSAAPPQVQPGCFVRACSRTAYCEFGNRSFARVDSISADRKTIKLTEAWYYTMPKSILLTTANKSAVVFIPGLVGAQMWLKKPIGPQMPMKKATAVHIEFTMPSLPTMKTLSSSWTKSTADAVFAANPGQPWGFWPALWLFGFRPADADGNGLLIDPTARPAGDSEIDMLEMWVRTFQGPNVWTGHMHGQNYNRNRALANGTENGCGNHAGTWQVADNPPAVGRAKNEGTILLDQPIANGQRRSISVIVTRDSVTHYLDGLPLAVSDFSTKQDYPYKLGLNCASGQMVSLKANELFFPHEDTLIPKHAMTIHRVRVWEI